MRIQKHWRADRVNNIVAQLITFIPIPDLANFRDDYVRFYTRLHIHKILSSDQIELNIRISRTKLWKVL
ncbi:hypothetical protein D3C76_1341790 [compost metagenome]